MQETVSTAKVIEHIKMKNIILSTILLFLLSSCGTRKTELEKTDNIKVKNTYQEGSKIVLGNNFTYTPFDNAKPMIIDGKKYNNAIVSNDKTKIIEKWKYQTKYKTVTIEKIKVVTRTNHDFLYLGMFLIVVGAVWAWFYLPKIK